MPAPSTPITVSRFSPNTDDVLGRQHISFSDQFYLAHQPPSTWNTQAPSVAKPHL
jgi:hypothetical protein